MATKVVRTDDLDGTDATHQVSIIVDGTRFNLDLGDVNFATFQSDVEKYLKLAEAKRERQRKAAATSTAAKKRTSSEPPGKKIIAMPDGTPIDKDAARIWGNENGWKVGMFVGPSVQEAYRDYLVELQEGKAQEDKPEDESGGE